MCKRISPDMVLYYALSTHDSVSSIELSRLHRELLSQIRELIVDTTLSSIQNVLRAVLTKETGMHINIILDVENYKEKSQKHIERLAKNLENNSNIRPVEGNIVNREGNILFCQMKINNSFCQNKTKMKL